MQTILTVVHVFLAVGVIGLVLMQHGKGADAGAAFGSGASGTVFGAQGAANFLSRTTAILAALFFVTSIALGYFSMQKGPSVDLMKDVANLPVPATPAGSESTNDLPPVKMESVVTSDVPVVPVSDKPSVPVTEEKPEATSFVAEEPVKQDNATEAKPAVGAPVDEKAAETAGSVPEAKQAEPASDTAPAQKSE